MSNNSRSEAARNRNTTTCNYCKKHHQKVRRDLRWSDKPMNIFPVQCDINEGFPCLRCREKGYECKPPPMNGSSAGDHTQQVNQAISLPQVHFPIEFRVQT